MYQSARTSAACGQPYPRDLLARWRADVSGVTAVEFGMVAWPFIVMLFGIIAVGLYFFTTFALENAVEQASRLLRTGQAQTANNGAGITSTQFKTKVCEFLPGFIDCNKVQVNVKSFPDTTNITPAELPTCLGADGNLSGVTEYTPGGASEVVLVWVCYEWELAGKVANSWFSLGDMSNGSRLIQATTVFRTEPYN
jgi:Flp pilus assembly pilin Flp